MSRTSKKLVFAAAYFAYASVYIARLNLTVASPVLQSERLLSSSQIGAMGGAFFLLYSLGQLLNGYLGDVCPPKAMVMTGLLLTAGTNLCIGLLPGAGVIVLLWAVNGFAQSMLWGPLLRTVADRFSRTRRSFIASLLVSSVGVGSILGIFLTTVAIRYQHVRYAFIWPGLVCLLAFFVVLFLFHSHAAPAAARTGGPSLRALLTPRVLLLLIPAMCHGVLKDGINLWVASYFVDTFSVDLVVMSFYVFAVPVLGLIGRLLYPPIYRLFGGREHAVSAAALGAAALCLVPLCLPGVSAGVAAVCLSVAAAAVAVVNTSFLSIYPMRFQADGSVSKMAGLMDFATYLGAGISSLLYGVWLESHTYTGMFLSWIFLLALAVGILSILEKRERVVCKKK